MSKQQLYSLQQIAKRLNIPTSTVAYYRKNYADFMPSTRLKGKRYPMYEEQAVEVVALVREMAENGGEQHEILKALENKYPPVIDKSGENTTNEQQTNEQPTTILATIQKQPEIISRLIGQQTELIRSQDTTLEAYKNQLIEKEKTIKELQDKLKEEKQRTEVVQNSQPKPRPPVAHKRRKKPKIVVSTGSEKPKQAGGGLWSKIFG